MKILKWIFGLLAGLASVVALFTGSKSKEKVKKIKKDLKTSKSEEKKIKNSINAIEETQKSYEKALKQIKSESYKAPKVKGKQANKFIKNLIKERKKREK